MKAARLVVLGVALAAGGFAAMLAGGSGDKTPAPAPTSTIDTVEILVAKADIERLIDRIDRLSREQEELRQSLDDSVFTGVRTPMDGSAIAGGAFLTIGGIIGWVMARVSQRRRDRRGRIRL